jgi:hypothetical protein
MPTYSEAKWRGDTIIKTMKLLLPDACWRADLVSGALFLYFHDETLGFTLHPSVSTFLTGADPFAFIRFVGERHPSWAQPFFKFIDHWNAYQAGLHAAHELFSPMRGTGFKSILVSYDRGASAWEMASDLLSSSTLSRSMVAQAIDPYSAADELFAHIFFEKYLEIYHPDLGPDDFVALGTAAARAARPIDPVVVDWVPLYEYCNSLFGRYALQDLLATAYMFRMPMLQQTDAVLLSNEGLVPFLASLPVQSVAGDEAKSQEQVLGPVAWEFFRQLVSPVLDPLDEGKVARISKLIDGKSREVVRLKARCLRLASDLADEGDFQMLQAKIRDYIRVNVRSEIESVLELDRRALSDLLTVVFSDEKVWLGISGFLYSLVNGGLALTAGSAICALSLFGSKAFKIAAGQREKLRATDFAILYRMKGK